MPARHSRPSLTGPVLALDLGATNARAAVVMPDGRVRARRAGNTPRDAGRDAIDEGEAGDTLVRVGYTFETIGFLIRRRDA